MGEIVWHMEFEDNNSNDIIKDHGDNIIGASPCDDSRGSIEGTIEDYNNIVHNLFNRTFKTTYRSETYTASYSDSEGHFVQSNIGYNKVANINEK